MELYIGNSRIEILTLREFEPCLLLEAHSDWSLPLISISSLEVSLLNVPQRPLNILSAYQLDLLFPLLLLLLLSRFSRV